MNLNIAIALGFTLITCTAIIVKQDTSVIVPCLVFWALAAVLAN